MPSLSKLLSFPPVKCAACGQTHHDFDVAVLDCDLPEEEKRVVFHRLEQPKDETERCKPYGKECYRCFDCRRTFYSLTVAQMQEKLNDAVEKDKFLERRADKASGRNSLKDEWVTEQKNRGEANKGGVQRQLRAGNLLPSR